MTTLDLAAYGRETMRFSRETYDAMIQSGHITEQDRVELINGQLIKKMSIGPRHGGTVKALVNLLCAKLGDRAVVAAQDPIALNEFSQPEPDLAVLRPPCGEYLRRHPEPADVFFLIEVADMSLRFDREAKIPLYAACDIPECWLVDLNAKAVTVFRAPADAGYGAAMEYRTGQAIPLPGFADLAIDPAEFGL